MSRRALLTDREREVLRGDAEVEDIARYQSKIRSRVRDRLDRLEEDVELLEDVEPELAFDARERVCDEDESRLARLERQVAILREQVNGNPTDLSES